jgi:hypothetical protein
MRRQPFDFVDRRQTKTTVHTTGNRELANFGQPSEQQVTNNRVGARRRDSPDFLDTSEANESPARTPQTGV